MASHIMKLFCMFVFVLSCTACSTSKHTPMAVSLPDHGAQGDYPAYQLYTGEGVAVSYYDMIKDLQTADVVLFGELHNNPIGHWLQLELSRFLYTVKKDKLVLGAEMFETDDQILLNEYLAGKIKEEHLINAGTTWPNYKTDYKPLVEFAKENKIPFIATNIPRRYANLVMREGATALEELDPAALIWLPPLPVAVDLEWAPYQKIMSMGMSHGDQKSMSEQGEMIATAQAHKDATMAHFLLKAWQPGKLFLHFNGSFHSDYHDSIYHYLKDANSELKILTISTTEQLEIGSLANSQLNSAHYIIVVPSTMTKTH